MTVYDSVDVSPLDKPRRTTNRITLIFFVLCMAVYFGIAIYAFVSGDPKKIKEHGKDIDYDLVKLYKKVLDKIIESKPYLIGFFIFSIISTLVCLCVVRTASRIIIKIAIFFEVLSLISNGFTLLTILIRFNAALFIAQFIMTAFVAWGVYVKVYVVKTIGTKFMSMVVKDATKAIFMFPGVMVISMLITLLVVAVIIFGLAVFVYLSTLADKASLFHVILHIVNLYCTYWLSAATLLFGLMISHGTFGTWYWTMDKSSLPADTTMKNVAIAFRYHIGTAAYLSSIWVIFPIICVMIRGLNNRAYQSRHNIFVMIVCWWNIFMRIFDSSIASTAIHGKSFTKAADTVCQLYLRFPVRLYAITKAYEWCVGVMLGISLLITFLASSVIIGTNDKSSDAVVVAILAFLVGMLIIIIPIAMLLNAAVTSVFYCILEDHEQSQEDRSRSSFMKAQIKELMTNEE